MNLDLNKTLSALLLILFLAPGLLAQEGTTNESPAPDSTPTQPATTPAPTQPATTQPATTPAPAPTPAAPREDALAEYRRGNFDRAVAITQREIQQNPANLDAYTVLGWSLLRLERYADTVRFAEAALQVRRYDYRIIQIMGEALFYLNRDNEAQRYFEEYVAINPSGNRIAQVYYFMGEIFLRARQFQRADIALTTALHHSPAVAVWCARLGYARSLSGDLENSRAAYREALRINPNLAEAREGLEQVNARQNQG